MAASLQSILDSLKAKIAEITLLNQTLQAQNRQLKEENAELRRQSLESDSQRDRALLDCEYLMMSHKLADSPDNLADTRRHLAKLIRNIDRCLDMLKE